MGISIENKFISQILLKGDILTLLIKQNKDDTNSIGSINFIGTIIFKDLGIINHKISSFVNGELNFSNRSYLSNQNIEIESYKQFYLATESRVHDQRIDLIVVCKDVLISEDSFLFSHMK